MTKKERNPTARPLVTEKTELLRACDAAPLLGMNERQVREAIWRGHLPAVKIGRHVRIPRRVIDEISGGASVFSHGSVVSDLHKEKKCEAITESACFEELAELVRIRNVMRITQAELAQRLHTDQGNLSGVERERRTCSAEFVDNYRKELYALMGKIATSHARAVARKEEAADGN